ncbi:MAG: lycopene cyclase family protein [Chitinophagaceae bacterium]
MFKSNSYDYIICGAGCAGLSLLMRMIRSGKFNDKKILLLDKEPKNKNDRTWCFWEKEKGFFEKIVYRKWNSISFLSNKYSSLMDITPYQYKMIRGIDFYQYCFNEIAKHTNVEVVYGDIKSWRYENKEVIFNINNQEFKLGNAQVFNSIYEPRDTTKKTIRLLQHFKGWVIETNKSSFNPDEATMMDFRVHQQHGTSFAYVLPFSSTSALVEYTLFTKELLLPEQYDKELEDYISTYLGIDDYEIKEEEFGIIPMTNEEFSFDGHGWQIGVAGGQTKASSGYTFQFIQKQSAQIADYLIRDKPLGSLPGTAKRFRFYDNTLLHILYYKKLPGDEIFTQLFQKNKPQQVLKFLDNESSLKDELKIISTLPTWPFLRAALKQL